MERDNEKYPQNLVASDVNINLSRPLDDAASEKLFSCLKDDEMWKLEFTAKEKKWKLSNGDDKDTPNQQQIFLRDGDSINIAWGREVAFSSALAMCKDKISKAIPFLGSPLSNFNAQVFFEIPSQGNAFEVISEFGHGAPLKSFNDKMAAKIQKQGEKFSIAGSEIKFLFYAGSTKVGMLKVEGKTTPQEILTGKFDDDPVTMMLGVQENRMPKDLPVGLARHIEFVHELANEIFVPVMVAKFPAVQKPNNPK